MKKKKRTSGREKGKKIFMSESKRQFAYTYGLLEDLDAWTRFSRAKHFAQIDIQPPLRRGDWSILLMLPPSIRLYKRNLSIKTYHQGQTFQVRAVKKTPDRECHSKPKDETRKDTNELIIREKSEAIHTPVKAEFSEKAKAEFDLVQIR